jgi:hypothetical protein
VTSLPNPGTGEKIKRWGKKNSRKLRRQDTRRFVRGNVPKRERSWAADEDKEENEDEDDALRGGVQIGFEQRAQFVRQSLRFFIEAGADVKGFGFDEKSFFFEDSIGEVEADAFNDGQPGFDGEKLVVAGGGFVAEAAFDDGKNDVLLLPLEKGWAELAEEFATRGFEDVEVA